VYPEVCEPLDVLIPEYTQRVIYGGKGLVLEYKCQMPDSLTQPISLPQKLFSSIDNVIHDINPYMTVVAKPIIYLYTQTTTDVKVELNKLQG
jgi:hypothetical protein